MISMMALALLVSACGSEQGQDREAENGYGADDEQLVGEEEVRGEADGLVASAAVTGRPPQRVLEGKRTIVCAGIQWQNVAKPGAGDAACQNLSEHLAQFYHDNSRGLLTLVPEEGHTVDVPYDGSHSNLAAAEKIVKETFHANYYVVPSIFTYPHASGGIAHVKSAQFMTAGHEVGHLLGLGHAGLYTYAADGTPKLNPYGDHHSIMSDSISEYLTPPQYYWLGWLPDEELAMYDPTVPSYLVKQISDFSGSGLSAVIVPPASKSGRWAFIGALRCPEGPNKTCVTLHLANRGGSLKVAESNDEIYDENFTGLHIKVLGFSGQRARISVDHAPKP
jgi:hypothetical protein